MIRSFFIFTFLCSAIASFAVCSEDNGENIYNIDCPSGIRVFEILDILHKTQAMEDGVTVLLPRASFLKLKSILPELPEMPDLEHIPLSFDYSFEGTCLEDAVSGEEFDSFICKSQPREGQDRNETTVFLSFGRHGSGKMFYIKLSNLARA